MGADGTAPAGEDRAMPAGRGLRLLLLHLFTAALRAGSAAAEIGPDTASVAAQLGLDAAPPRLRELEEQAERLVAAKLRVGLDGRPALSVLDARRLGKGGGPHPWRPVLHLSARFFASLQQNAVPLDRQVVTALADSAQALDAYAWLAASLPGVSSDQPKLVPWEELQRRLGQAGTAGLATNAAAFRAAFAESLDMVGAAWPAARLTAGEEGVTLLGLSPADAPSMPATEALPPSVDDGAEEQDAFPADQAVDEEDGLQEAAEAETAPQPAPETLAPETPAPAVAVMPPPARIRLAPVLTGLSHSVWLRRGGEQESATLEVTPGATDHPAQRSLLILEPMVLQVTGYLQPREVEQVAAWVAANAELIQDYWDGAIASVFDVAGRVKPVPASRW